MPRRRTSLLQQNTRHLIQHARLLCDETSTLFLQADYLVHQSEMLVSHASIATQKSFKSLIHYVFKLKKASIMLYDVSALLKLVSYLLDIGCKHAKKVNSIIMVHRDRLTFLMWLETLYYIKGLVLCLIHLYSVKEFICSYIKWVAQLQQKAALLVMWSMLLLERNGLLFDASSVHRTLLLVNKKQAQCFHKKTLLLFRLSRNLTQSKLLPKRVPS